MSPTRKVFVFYACATGAVIGILLLVFGNGFPITFSVNSAVVVGAFLFLAAFVTTAFASSPSLAETIRFPANLTKFSKEVAAVREFRRVTSKTYGDFPVTPEEREAMRRELADELLKRGVAVLLAREELQLYRQKITWNDVLGVKLRRDRRDLKEEQFFALWNFLNRVDLLPTDSEGYGIWTDPEEFLTSCAGSNDDDNVVSRSNLALC
jgi:hypothetical protein